MVLITLVTLGPQSDLPQTHSQWDHQSLEAQTQFDQTCYAGGRRCTRVYNYEFISSDHYDGGVVEDRPGPLSNCHILQILQSGGRAGLT